MSQRTIEARVEGRVQGISFRQATAAQAHRAGLMGYAENRADGSVRVVLQGESAAIDELVRWLERGPEQAEVSNLSTRELHDAEQWSDFSTR